MDAGTATVNPGRGIDGDVGARSRRTTGTTFALWNASPAPD
jgi:hypothetical protein